MKTNTEINDKKFLTPKEVAQYLGVSRSTVSKLVRDGVLPEPKELSPRVRRFSREDVDAALNK